MASGYTEDFDAILCPDGDIHIFAVNTMGSLCHIAVSKEKVYTNVLLETKGDGKKICRIRVVRINSKFHLFYCLVGTERLLIHQIASFNDYSIKPYVIDRIGKKCIYDIAIDDEDNIHTVYTSDNGKIKHVGYIYARKSHAAPTELADYEAGEIRCIVSGGVLYTAFTAPSGGRTNIYVHSLTNGMCTTVTVNVKRSTQLAIIGREDGICIGWTENGMFFTVDAARTLVVSRVNIVGKCMGLTRYGVCNCKDSYCTSGISQSGLPYENFEEWKEDKPRYKGYEAEKYAQKYKELLMKQKENDFKNDLLMIEASLERLINLIENALEKSVITPKEEYNIEVKKEEDISDE